MARQTISNTAQGRKDEAGQVNANFAELYAEQVLVKADTITANTTLVVPATYKIDAFVLKNTTANAVTINVGTTGGASDVINAVSVGANAVIDIVPLLKIFSDVNPQTLYLSSTAWSSASLSLRVLLEKVF